MPDNLRTMRILQICHKPPRPAKDGGCLAIDAITTGLCAGGAQVKVLTAFTRKHPLLFEEIDPEYAELVDLEGVPLETGVDVRDAYIALLNGASYNISRFYSHQFAMVIKRVLSRNRYDVVHLESLYTTPYIETIRMHAPTALISLRSHNHEFLIWEQRWKATRNPINRMIIRHLSKSLERYEKSVIDSVDAIVAISSIEAMGYRNWGYTGPLHVSGFGIDSASVQEDGTEERTKKRSGPIRMFHLGAMDWDPNKEGMDWFAKEVWPSVREAHPLVEFHVAGRGLDQGEWAEVDGMFNHGEVPDAEAFGRPFDLLVVPLLRGAGIRVKIVEAMSRGIPVASTSTGLHGLELLDSGAVVHADPEGFAGAIISLLDQPEKLDEMASAGREMIRTGFNRDAIGAKLLEFYGRHVKH